MVSAASSTCFSFVAGPRLGQLVGQCGYGFAFLAAKLIGDPDENFPMIAGDGSGPRIGRLERFAFQAQTSHGFGSVPAGPA